jgi:hypothetical protein
MEIELIVNAAGKIIAAVERKAPAPAEDGKISTIPSLRAAPGQHHHVIKLSDELAAMPLKEVFRTCRFASDDNGPRLERA